MRQLLHALHHPSAYPWLELRPWRRHSLVLSVAGAAYIAIGLTYVLATPAPSRTDALEVPLNLAPLSVWGVAWVIVGLLSMLSARWPPASEKWGYSALSGLAAWWAASYLAGVLLGAENQSVSGALVWGLVAFMWWGISGLDNPDGGGPALRGEL